MSETQEERIQRSLADVLGNLSRPKNVCVPRCDLLSTEQVIVNKMCPSCLEHTPIYGTPEQFHDFHCRKQSIQKVFPSLSIAQAETLLSGFCGPCWDLVFTADDEDED